MDERERIGKGKLQGEQGKNELLRSTLLSLVEMGELRGRGEVG